MITQVVRCYVLQIGKLVDAGLAFEMAFVCCERLVGTHLSLRYPFRCDRAGLEAEVHTCMVVPTNLEI